MSWLSRFFNGHAKPVSPEIQEALDTAHAAETATTEAKSAVSGYWEARAANERAREKALGNEYDRADQQIRRP